MAAATLAVAVARASREADDDVAALQSERDAAVEATHALRGRVADAEAAVDRLCLRVDALQRAARADVAAARASVRVDAVARQLTLDELDRRVARLEALEPVWVVDSRREAARASVPERARRLLAVGARLPPPPATRSDTARTADVAGANATGAKRAAARAPQPSGSGLAAGSRPSARGAAPPRYAYRDGLLTAPASPSASSVGDDGTTATAASAASEWKRLAVDATRLLSARAASDAAHSAPPRTRLAQTRRSSRAEARLAAALHAVVLAMSFEQ